MHEQGSATNAADQVEDRAFRRRLRSGRLEGAGRLIRTVAQLGLTRLLWRLRYVLERRCNRWFGTSDRRYRWRGSRAPSPNLDGKTLLAHPLLCAPLPASLPSREGACWLGHEWLLEPIDWRLGPSTIRRLEVVGLHEHGWSLHLARAAAAGRSGSEAAATEFRRLIEHWIDNCSLSARGSLNLAWNSHVLSARLCHWIASYSVARNELFAGAPAFERRVMESLWTQAAFLHEHLEWDVRGNHLVRSALALATAGRFFDVGAARRWVQTAERITRVVLDTQILPDGAHDERSTHYHLQVMDELIRLAVLLPSADLRDDVRSTWQRMADWLVDLAGPFPERVPASSRELPALNDGTPSSFARARAALSTHAPGPTYGEPRSGLTLLRHSGHIVWRSVIWQLVFDVGDFGPRDQPGHSHADALQLLGRAFGHSLFIDLGSTTYDRGAQRCFERGTAAHNTVTVDGQDSSEIWDVFRVGRRQRSFDVHAEDCEGDLLAGAWHDGFKHLKGAPIHQRTLRSKGSRLIIEDQVSGRGHHRVEGGFLIDPVWRFTPAGDRSWNLRIGPVHLLMEASGPRDLRFMVRRHDVQRLDGEVARAPRWTWTWSGCLPTTVRVTLTPCRRCCGEATPG